MTHDELLAKINKMNDWDEFDPAYMERWEKNAHKKHDALRAVVELAKNTDKKPSDLLDETDKWFMLGWNAAMKETILAIEKELK